jgi:starvation-inducible DNA-binding protein
VNSDHRDAIAKVGDTDPVSEDVLIAQPGQLELFQWFVRAHLESENGGLPTAGVTSEVKAAAAAADIRHPRPAFGPRRWRGPNRVTSRSFPPLSHRTNRRRIPPPAAHLRGP